jgi:hypothetical protein
LLPCPVFCFLLSAFWHSAARARIRCLRTHSLPWRRDRAYPTPRVLGCCATLCLEGLIRCASTRG